MAQQKIDSKFSEHGLKNTEPGLSSGDKQTPVRKTALRDLKNDNILMVPKAMKNSPFSKEKGSSFDAIQVSGMKRSSPECPVSSPHHQSPSSNAANGQFVYVRRKSEAKVGKSSSGDNMSNNTDNPSLNQQCHQEETTQPKAQIKEAKVSSFSALAPAASLLSYSSGKPSVPFPLGKSGIRLPTVESSYVPVTNNPSLDATKRRNNQNWEDRYLQLQMLLRKLDQSNQEDYLQMLRSLLPAELSRHAVELEKRAIQLALEEGKEMERVAFLNVLRRSPDLTKTQPTQ